MRLIFLGLFLWPVIWVHAATVYKYQDANGRWQFSDKPPASSQQPAEQLQFAADPANPFELKFKYSKKNGNYKAEVINPFFIPLDLKITFKHDVLPEFKALIPSAGRLVFYQGIQKVPHFKYAYEWGDPAAIAQTTPYHLPVSSLQQHVISQAFNGRFSHRQEPNIYAVDIGLPVGTNVAAAREGTVIFVHDDYAFGGAQDYFLDKANAVYVLHDDGTYAVYAHLLLGSAVVKAGQKVKVGEVLAQSGSSGYSTGPHLHFVVRKNNHFAAQSVPFTFTDARGVFTPARKLTVCPCP